MNYLYREQSSPLNSMVKARTFLFGIVLFLSILPLVTDGQQGESKNILVLFSLSPTTPAYHLIMDGIRTRLTENFGDVYTLHIEYLETERYPKGKYPKERFDIYNEKYREVDLDLLICVGNDIVSTIKALADKHIKNLPAVSFDLDFSAFGIQTEISLNYQTAEIPIKINPVRAISTAVALFPERSSIYFIGGISALDRIYMTISKEAARNFASDKKVTYMTEESMDEVLRRVRHLSDSSMIIVPSFYIDSKLVPYYNPEAVRLISKAANAPVFTYSDMGFGEGAVGGYLVNFKKAGLLAGDVTVKVINGADPNSIIITEKDYYDYLFDWRALQRWGIDTSSELPEGSIILYREENFFSKYGIFIGAGMLFLLLQTILIIKLIRSNMRQRLITRQLVESENKFKDLVREDRVLRIGQLTASLSHELNQPLTAILSTAQAGIRFIDSGKSSPELLKNLLQNIVDSDKRTASILNSLRGMMKLEKREKEKVDLNILIHEVIGVYNSEAILKKIKIDVNLVPGPVYIMADPIQIQQVMLNLITNAAQAMEKIKPEERVISVTETSGDEDVTVAVKDCGEGIDEATMGKLFKPFATSREEGLGIGLAISHAIISDHQGKIRGNNISDGGAEFSFSLKVIHDES